MRWVATILTNNVTNKDRPPRLARSVRSGPRRGAAASGNEEAHVLEKQRGEGARLVAKRCRARRRGRGYYYYGREHPSIEETLPELVTQINRLLDRPFPSACKTPTTMATPEVETFAFQARAVASSARARTTTECSVLRFSHRHEQCLADAQHADARPLASYRLRSTRCATL
jgi:hypothetical protein